MSSLEKIWARLSTHELTESHIAVLVEPSLSEKDVSALFRKQSTNRRFLPIQGWLYYKFSSYTWDNSIATPDELVFAVSAALLVEVSMAALKLA